MWWMFMDPESFGRAVLITLVLVIIAVIGLSIYFTNNPGEWNKIEQSYQERHVRAMQRDTVINNDTTYIIEKRIINDTISIFKKIK
jgi:hypothetical protein